MTYAIVSNPDVEATFRKIGKKDITRFEQLVKKPPGTCTPYL